MDYLDPIDFEAPGFGAGYDELPLWSAPFGLDVLDRVPLGRDLTYVDLGAGTGFITIELAERCGPSARVIAVDPWQAGLAQLRAKVARRSLINVQCLEADAAAMELPASSVDVFVSSLGVNNFADPVAVMQTCGRAAKPGATFVLATNLAGHMAEFYAVYREVLVQTGQHDRIALLEQHVAHRATIESLHGLLAAGRFDVRNVATGSFRLRFASGAAMLRHTFMRLGFVQGWKAIASPHLLSATFTALEAALDRVASERGELGMTIPTACVVARRV